jgi:hypothetical protein
MNDTTQEELPPPVAYISGNGDGRLVWAERVQSKAKHLFEPLYTAEQVRQCIATLKAENEKLREALSDASTAWAFAQGQLTQRAQAAQSQAAQDVETLTDLTVHLIAAVDLLERGGKKAAASDKMFAQMLLDYKASIERGRAAIRAAEWKKSRVYFGWNTTHMK